MNPTLTTTTATTPDIDAGATRRRSLVIGATVTALAVTGTLWAVLKGPADASQTRSIPYVAAAAFLVGCALFGWLVPKRIAARGTGLPLAIVAAPFAVAYWSAWSLLIATAGILVALAHRAHGGPRPGRALAAIILACPVILVTVVGILFG